MGGALGCTAKSYSEKVEGLLTDKSPERDVEISPDQAAIYRANIGAIKMLAKSKDSSHSLLLYLKSNGNLDKLLNIYLELVEIKELDKDNLGSRTSALLWRCKSEYDECKVHLGLKKNGLKSSKFSAAIQSVVWECLGSLRSTNIKKCHNDQLLFLIGVVQQRILHGLMQPFEGYLKSEFYHKWQQERLDNAKEKKKPLQETKVNNGYSHQLDTYSKMYPHVLVVDDSPVTVKLVGRSLEIDGHRVDRAINGDMALNLMKTKEYDVVLIDINMPVLDGYETVRTFRQFERLNVDISNLVSEVSSLSDDHVMNEVDEKDESTPPLTQEVGSECNETTIGDNETPAKPNINSNKVVPTVSNCIFSQKLFDTKFDAARKIKPSSAGTVTLTKESLLMNSNGIPAFNGNFPSSTKMPDYHNQFIIGMSSSIDDETKKKAIACGMDYFLPKPFTLDKFVEAIRDGHKASFER